MFLAIALFLAMFSLGILGAYIQERALSSVPSYKGTNPIGPGLHLYDLI